jgi:hypothetical protein
MVEKAVLGNITFFTIRINCKYKIKCPQAQRASGCEAKLTPAQNRGGALTAKLKLPGQPEKTISPLMSGLDPREVPCPGRCTNRESTEDVKFTFYAAFSGDVSTTINGTVDLNLTLAGCGQNPRNSRRMVLVIKNSMLDEDESDYDGDGKKNKSESGASDPAWDPDK